MDAFSYITIILLSILIVFTFVIQPIRIVRDLINHFYRDTLNRHLIFYRLKPRYKKILGTYSIYYRKLTPKNKRVFERRLAKFLAMKEFIPRGGLEKITDEMKVLIGSKAIQITFGHPSVYFEHFWRILVYQDSYYSQISRQYHKGEVNAGGFIILSWKSFIEGMADHDSGINLGLHELAHALHIENAITNNEYNFLNEKKLSAFHEMAYAEMERIKKGDGVFFRDYAATNIHEFFAVMVENFFERPSEFKSYNPALYALSTHLLQQDPLLPDPIGQYFR